MMQILFFPLAAITVLSSYALLAYIFIRLFHIVSFSGQLSVVVILLFIFLNILLSSYFIHKINNLVTRYYYIIASFLLGLSLNFCLVAILIAILKLFNLLFLISVPDLYLQIIFIGIGFGLTIFGFYRARWPKITEYSVNIKNLPLNWDNKTIVQLSDIHLGAFYRKKFFYRLLDRVSSLKPEAVFITGDLFDGMEAGFDWLNKPFDRLKIPQGIYYSFGNHDLYLGFHRVSDLLKDNPIKILDNEMLKINGLQIIGISFSFDNNFNLEEEIKKQKNYSSKQPSILLYHAPKNIELSKKAGIDLQLSGHTHDGQLWPLNHIVSWIHKGYGYGFFKEKDFSLVVTSGVGSWGPPLRTSTRSEIVKIVLHRK